MQKFIEVTGDTEEEALAKGLTQLGLTRDEVSLELLARPKKGFLGIGSVPARIRLTYEAPDEVEPEPAPVAEKPAPAPAAEKPAPKPAPKAQKPRQDKPKAERPKPEKKPEPRPAPAPVETVAASAPAQKGEPDAAVVEGIKTFQAGLFQRMGVEAAPVVEFDGQTYQVTLEGEDLGPLIGHRGETLDAVQQLTGYAVNKGRSHRARIHVDAEGYRARREESLTRLARKTADKAMKYRRNMTLEPMNAYERHVIHAALQEYPGVSTHSTGVEPNRRVVVQYDP